MTPEERAWTKQVHEQVMKLLGTFGNIERHAEAGSDQAKRARRGALAALALAQEAKDRLTSADVDAEAQEVAAGGYDLAALATAPPSSIED